MLERIERDATALWHVKSPAAQDELAINPDEFESKIIDELVAKMRDGGVSLRLFDVTSDIGIPTIAAYIGETRVLTTGSPRYVDVTFGCGTHPGAGRFGF